MPGDKSDYAQCDRRFDGASHAEDIESRLLTHGVSLFLYIALQYDTSAVLQLLVSQYNASICSQRLTAAI
jgi:hypothetical protein